MQALRAEGVSMADIGRRYGMSRQRVHQMIGPDPGKPSMPPPGYMETHALAQHTGYTGGVGALRSLLADHGVPRVALRRWDAAGARSVRSTAWHVDAASEVIRVAVALRHDLQALPLPEGYTLSVVLAAESGRSRHTVAAICRRAGVEECRVAGKVAFRTEPAREALQGTFRWRFRAGSPEVQALADEVRRGGITIAALARREGTSPQVLRSALAKAGVQARPRRAVKPGTPAVERMPPGYAYAGDLHRLFQPAITERAFVGALRRHRITRALIDGQRLAYSVDEVRDMLQAHYGWEGVPHGKA
jgi:lambda repressor-like predicted transcriptional regulator